MGADDPDELEKARALRDVMEHAVNQTIAVALAKEMKTWRARPIILAGLAVLSVLLTTFTLLAEPDWAYGPDPAAIAPEKREAHLRFAMFLVAERVEAHRAAIGVLPQSLAEIGEDWPRISYRTSDSAFAVIGQDSSAGELTLWSVDDATTFVGRSREFLREQQK